MEKEDCASKVFECPVSSSNGFDFLDLAIDSFCSGIGLRVAQRVTDAFLVSSKHLGNPDDLRHSLLLHTLKPEREILFGIRESAASKDGLELLC